MNWFSLSKTPNCNPKGIYCQPSKLKFLLVNQIFWFRETFFTNQVTSFKILGTTATKIVTSWRVACGNILIVLLKLMCLTHHITIEDIHSTTLYNYLAFAYVRCTCQGTRKIRSHKEIVLIAILFYSFHYNWGEECHWRHCIKVHHNIIIILLGIVDYFAG